MLNIYFLGVFIVAALLLFLFEFDIFRSYIEQYASILNNENIHPYSYFLPFIIISSALSWLGLIMLIALFMYDYLDWKK